MTSGPRRPPIELVVLDCDGVLVDTEPLSIQVELRILENLGWSMTEAEVIERFLGRSDEYMRREIETTIGRSLPADWEEQLMQHYREAFAAELVPVAGVVAALDRIPTPTCVASSGTHDKMRYTLGVTGLLPRFEGRVFSATEVAHGKPAPDLFLYAAERLGVDPAVCAVVEDSTHGVQAARAAGMRAFGYAGGVTPAERLAGADTVVFHDMRDLPDLLDAAE